MVEQVLHMRRGEGSEMAAVETTLPPQHQVTAVVDRVAEAADCSSSRLSAREVPVAKVVDLDCLQVRKGGWGGGNFRSNFSCVTRDWLLDCVPATPPSRVQGELARLMQRPVKDASWKG